MVSLGAYIRLQGAWLSQSVPLIPIAIRWILLCRHSKAFGKELKSPSPEAHRSWLIGILGFSLAGLAIITSSPALPDLKYAAYDLVIGFCLTNLAMAIQSYKARFWQDQLADSLRDGASGCIAMFILRLTAALELRTQLDSQCVWVVAILALLAWMVEWVPSVKKSVDYAASLALTRPIQKVPGA